MGWSTSRKASVPTLPDEAKPPRSVGLDHVEEGQLKVREQDEWIWERALERYEPMMQSVYDGPDPKFAYNSARKLRMPKAINTDWRPETHILMGGSIEAPGEVVKPGVLSAIGLEVDGEAGDPYVLPEDLASRRLGLAKWVADAAQLADHAVDREPRLAVSFRQAAGGHAEQLWREGGQTHAS